MNNRIKILLFTLLSVLAFSFVLWVFYEQEVKYALPTPIPENFIDVEIGETIQDEKVQALVNHSSTLFHFYSFECSCSRFNMEQFQKIVKKYGGAITIKVILQSDDTRDITRFKEKYDMDVAVVLDHDGSISDLLGIYSTPQAVILNEASTIYFKGNYNKARFCTKSQTQYTEIALNYYLKGEKMPESILKEMSMPYGCSLPSDQEDINDITFLEKIMQY